MKKKTPLLGVKLTGGLEEEMTSWAGVSLAIELWRKSGAMEITERVLPQKKSSKGLTPGQMVESFILLSALGGDCVDDMEKLRQDKGLAAMLGYTPPASETARQWLDKFHEEELMEGRPLQGSFLPPESNRLAGLKEVNRRQIWAYIEAVRPGWDVTFDIDAHLVETSKADAKYCYEGHKAFQPAVVTWAETGLVMADEFREGNVPASRGIKGLVDESYEMLPPGPWRVRVRSDSAAYEQKNLDHWQDRGWEFAVSADMSPQLKQEVEGQRGNGRYGNKRRGGRSENGLRCPMCPAGDTRRGMLHPIAMWRSGYAGSKETYLKMGPRCVTMLWQATFGIWKGKLYWNGSEAKLVLLSISTIF